MLFYRRKNIYVANFSGSLFTAIEPKLTHGSHVVGKDITKIWPY